jgi:uncharacterized iron-regulated protein
MVVAAHPRKPAVVFEHLDRGQEGAVGSFLRGLKPETVDWAAARDTRRLLARFDAAVGWQRRGWPAIDLYAPLIRFVLRHGMTLVPGNGPRGLVRSIARKGLVVMEPALRNRLRVEDDLPVEMRDDLLAELAANHCGVMAKSAFGTMADAQRVRDAFLARSMIDAAATHGSAVLIAGNGHVRRDRGVPWHLGRQTGGASSFAVLFIEVAVEAQDAFETVRRSGLDVSSADLFVLTRRVDRVDPCIAMRKRFKGGPN